MTNLDAQYLDEHGYVVIPEFLCHDKTAEIRSSIDGLLPPPEPAELEDRRRVHDLRHPIAGRLMAELVTPALIETARMILRCDQAANLRLLEQVLIRTDPSPPPYGSTSWHIDFAFFPQEYAASPRQTYYHLVQMCSTVEPDGGAFTIVPGSHHNMYSTAAQCATAEDLAAFKRAPIESSGVHVAEAVEVCGNDGDLIVFNPMCVHSASKNGRSYPRYVYFSSFFDVSAERLKCYLRATDYIKAFSNDLQVGLPDEFKSLLDW